MEPVRAECAPGVSASACVSIVGSDVFVSIVCEFTSIPAESLPGQRPGDLARPYWPGTESVAAPASEDCRAVASSHRRRSSC